MLEEIKAGIYVGFAKGLDAETYHAAPYASQSFLKRMRVSPAHARVPMESTPAMDMGTWVHMAMLEPKKFLNTIGIRPEGHGATKAVKDAVSEAAANGITLIRADDFASIAEICAKLKNHPIASKLFQGGESEVSYFWEDKETGMKCKARADYLREKDGILVDLKTVGDSRTGASAAAFRRQMIERGHHYQSAMYLDGFNQLAGKSSNLFVHCVVETYAPHGIRCIVLDDPALEFGRREYRKQLLNLKTCKDTGRYPAYEEKIASVSLPDRVSVDE